MSWKDKYDEVGDFHGGRTYVVLNNKSGHVDENGNITTPIIYDDVGLFAANGAAWVQISGVMGYVDKSGKVIYGWHDLIKGCFK
jgi:hypothetical protein